MSEPSTTERDRIEKLADSFMASFRAGQRPSIDAYVEQYPELAGELRSLIAALIVLERNAPRRIRPDHLPIESNVARSPREIGEFTIVREIGRGGMGVVYEAVQQSLGRHVALKVLSSGSLLNPTHLERFRLEARSAGRLHHNHIVPVFGVGESDGVHFYAMQFIAGQSLDQVIAALCKLRPGRFDQARPVANHELTESVRQSMSPGQSAYESEYGRHADGADRAPPATTRTIPAENTDQASPQNVTGQLSSGSTGRPFYESVARVGLQVSEALAYAHGEGILHRDIKPSNLLLDVKGNTWITDFGLVKAEDTQSLTETGDFVGTLRYMAPERLEGWSDRRSDLYSLGATLYELLTLRPFFEMANRAQLVDYIQHKQPEAPTKIDPAIPRDLETIVLKALAKEPGSRYHSAEEMADDLRRFLEDKPILARRSTPAEQFVRWCRRNRLVASLSAIAAAALLAGTIGSSWQALRATRAEQLAEARLAAEQTARQEADQARVEAVGQRRIAEQQTATARAQTTEAQGQRARAEASFQQAAAAVDRYFTLVSENTLFDVPGLEPLRRDLMSGAIEFYEKAALQRNDDPAVQFDLAARYLRMGSIHMGLNEVEESQASINDALIIIDRLRREHPGASHLELKLAGFWKERRWTQNQMDAPQDSAAMIQTMQRLERIWTELAERHPSEPGFRMDLANVYAMIGEGLWIKELTDLYPWEPGFPMDLGYVQKMLREGIWIIGTAENSTAYFERNRFLAETLVHEFPSVPAYRANAAVGCDAYAVFLITTGRHDAAFPVIRRMVQLSEDLSAEFPTVPAYRAILAQGLTMLGCLSAKSDPDGAEESLHAAVKLSHGLMQEFPDHRLFIQEWGISVTALAALQVATAPATADFAVNQVVDSLEARIRVRPYDHKLRGQLADFCHRAGREFLMRGSPLAVPLERRAKALFSELAEEFPNNVHYREHAGRAEHNLGVLAFQNGQYEVAKKHFEDASDVFARLADDTNVSPRDGWYRGLHAEALLQIATVNASLGNILEAIIAARQSVDVSTSLVRQFPSKRDVRDRLLRATRILSQQFLAADQAQEAVETCRRQVTLFEEIGQVSPISSELHMVRARLALAFLLIKTGALCEARQVWETATSDNTLDSDTLIGFAWDLAAPRDVDSNAVAMAVDAALRAKQLMPNDAMVFNTLGVVQYRANSWEEAIASFAKAESLSPETPLTCYGFFRAMAYWQMGNQAEALRWYDRSVEMIDRNQPNNDEIVRTRAETEQLLNIVENELTDQPAIKP